MKLYDRSAERDSKNSARKSFGIKRFIDLKDVYSE